MLIIALALAVIGLAALVFAVVTSNALVAWVCIGASALGVILLTVDALRDRNRHRSESAEPSDRSDQAEPVPETPEISDAADADTAHEAPESEHPAESEPAEPAEPVEAGEEPGEEGDTAPAEDHDTE